MQLGKYSVSVDLRFGSTLFLIVLRRTWGERSRSKKFYGSNWVLIKLLDCYCSKPFHKCHIEEWYTSVHKRHTSKLQPYHFLKVSWESGLVWNTLISHFIRYTLLLLSWSPFRHQKYISCSWHRFNHETETLPRDSGRCWYVGITHAKMCDATYFWACVMLKNMLHIFEL